jgi:hypothetical protein
MKNLSESICYLSGAIDRAPDLGKGWRNEFITKTLHLNMQVIDPCNKPASCVHEVTGDVRTVSTMREKGEWHELQRFVKQFRREDLRFTDVSDFLVVYIDPNVPSYGTLDELFTAEDQKKPCLCIVKGGLAALPTWLFGVFNLDEVFATIDECVSYLNKIDSGEIKMDRRWVVFRKQLREQSNKNQCLPTSS